MRKSAMMRKSEDGTFDIAKNIQIRRFCRQNHGGGRKSRFAIKSGTRETRAGQKVSDGFQEPLALLRQNHFGCGCGRLRFNA